MINVGIDLVEISRLQNSISRANFLQRCFCDSEIEQYYKHNKLTYLAGRFAAKEAVVKALGTGLIEGLSLTDIEITQMPSGAPNVVLKDKALEIANMLGISKWLISISHTANYATAIVLAE